MTFYLDVDSILVWPREVAQCWRRSVDFTQATMVEFCAKIHISHLWFSEWHPDVTDFLEKASFEGPFTS